MAKQYKTKQVYQDERTLIGVTCDHCGKDMEFKDYRSYAEGNIGNAFEYPEGGLVYYFELCHECAKELLEKWLTHYEDVW